MKKILLIFLGMVIILSFSTGCVKRIEVQDQGETVLIPEKSKPYMEEAVAVEDKAENLKEDISEKKAVVDEAEEEYQEAKENEANLEKYNKVKESKGKLWWGG